MSAITTNVTATTTSTSASLTTTSSTSRIGPTIPLTIVSTLPTVPTVSLPVTKSLLPSDAVVVQSYAELSLIGTTVTAYQAQTLTDEAVLNGDIISFRGPGINVGHDQTVSLGYNILEDATTSAPFVALPTPITILLSPSLPGPPTTVSTTTGVTTVIPSSAHTVTPYTTSGVTTGTGPPPTSEPYTTHSLTLPGPEMTSSYTTPSLGPGPVSMQTSYTTTEQNSYTTTTASTGSPPANTGAAAAAPSAPLNAGKVAMLLGAVGGLVAYAF